MAVEVQAGVAKDRIRTRTRTRMIQVLVEAVAVAVAGRRATGVVAVGAAAG